MFVWFHTLVYIICYLLVFELIILEDFGDKPLSGGFSDGDSDDSGDSDSNNSLIDSYSHVLIFLIVVCYHWRR